MGVSVKCVGCGAQLDAEQEICPYCGRVNEPARRRSYHLRSLEEQNRQEGREILKGHRFEIFCRVHRWVNIALAVAVLIAGVASFVTYLYSEAGYFRHKAGGDVIRTLYENGDYGELYIQMSNGDYFGDAKYIDCAQAALYYNYYKSCQIKFATAYEKYVAEGVYDRYALDWCVENAYSCCAYYHDFEKCTPEDPCYGNAERLREYQDRIELLMTGRLQIPEEMIDAIDMEYYSQRQELTAYVLGVLPNEE